MQTKTETLSVGTRAVLTAEAAHEYNADGTVYCTHAVRGDAGVVLADYGEGFAVVRWDRTQTACDVDVNDIVAVGAL
jgi:hypothetical protein